jgi:thioredoxin 1
MQTFSKIINGDKPVLVDFHAKWCPPCRLMEPELKQFAEEYKKQIRVLKIDVDKNPQTANQFNVQGVPTIILFRKGRVLWRHSGAMGACQISDIVKYKI